MDYQARVSALLDGFWILVELPLSRGEEVKVPEFIWSYADEGWGK